VLAPNRPASTSVTSAKPAGSEQQWQKCRVFAANPANRLLGFPVASPSQGLELMGHWARFLIASSEQLIRLIGYIRDSLC